MHRKRGEGRGMKGDSFFLLFSFCQFFLLLARVHAECLFYNCAKCVSVLSQEKKAGEDIEERSRGRVLLLRCLPFLERRVAHAAPVWVHIAERKRLRSLAAAERLNEEKRDERKGGR